MPCKMLDRQWMKTAKAFRCIIELPNNQVLASALTALIETHVKLSMTSDEGHNIEIEPAFILDVRTKGRRFHLVVETVWEGQLQHGPYITLMVGQNIRVSAGPCEQNLEQIQADPTKNKQPRLPAPGKIGQAQIVGLHSQFFKLPRFQRYVEIQGGATVVDAESCKEVFKALHKVESTRDLDMVAFQQFLQGFNQWLNGGPAQCP
jgi:hypothetical protein